MILRTVSSKNTTLYYVQKSFRQDNGKNATKYVEKLGNIDQLKARFGENDPIGEAKKYIAELTKAEKDAQKSVFIECKPLELINKGSQRCYNGGYLFLQKVYHELGLDKISKKIDKKYKNEYNLDSILSMLLYTRILYPGSKLSSLEDAKRFIKSESCTGDGELAQHNSYSLNKEMIAQEERFDGFYGICTDLEDAAPEIIKLNGGRWIIEDCFRITKTEFEARPVFLQRDDRIEAHFLTCFLALILYKYLAKKINRGGMHFTPADIIGTLQDMNFLNISGEGYIPTYTRTDLTNYLHGSAGFRTDTQIVTKKAMRSIIASTRRGVEKDEE